MFVCNPKRATSLTIKIILKLAFDIVEMTLAQQQIHGVNRHAGFTLIELVTVMVLIGIVAIVAIPRFSLMTGFKDVGYRDQAMAAVEYARKIAVAQRRHTCVAIATNSVTLTSDHGLPLNHASGVCPSPLLLPSGSNTITAPNNVTATTTASIDFDAEGRPAAGAPATLSISDSSSGSTSSLTIDAESGYVHY